VQFKGQDCHSNRQGWEDSLASHAGTIAYAPERDGPLSAKAG